jgi:mycothiol synthase
MKIRPFAGEPDLPLLVEMFNHDAAVTPGENATSVDELRADIHRPGVDVGRHVVVVEDSARIVGFAAIIAVVKDDKVEMHLWLRSAPEVASQVDPQLAEWFVNQGKQTAQEKCLPVELLAMAGETAHARSDAFNRLDFVPARYFFRMACSLSSPIAPAAFPKGYSLRALRGLDEMIDWVSAFNASFVDHWHFTPLTLEKALHFAEHDPNYSREGDLVATAPDGKIAGFCQCVIRANENAVTGRREGWIALLGTCRGHRRVGLGRALLTAGLEWIAAQGMNHALLGVDGDNPTGALGLYESVGFKVIHRRSMFVRNIG